MFYSVSNMGKPLHWIPFYWANCENLWYMLGINSWIEASNSLNIARRLCKLHFAYGCISRSMVGTMIVAKSLCNRNVDRVYTWFHWLHFVLWSLLDYHSAWHLVLRIRQGRDMCGFFGYHSNTQTWMNDGSEILT